MVDIIAFYLPLVTISFETTSMYANPLARCIEYAIGVFLASYFKERKAGEKYPIKYFGLMIYIMKVAIPSDYMLYSIAFLPIWMIVVVGMSKIHISNMYLIKLIQYFGQLPTICFLSSFLYGRFKRK